MGLELGLPNLTKPWLRPRSETRFTLGNQAFFLKNH